MPLQNVVIPAGPPFADEDGFVSLPDPVIFLVVGMVGVLLNTWFLHARPRPIPLKPKDSELFPRQTCGDGEALHKSVPKDRWCVSLEDLRQLRRLVMHAVAQGMIRPTEKDKFDVSDLACGPSVYTVTEQFVRPATALAGNMSWALLKNATGLRCDVFVTHCWAEGIYEFLDRLEHTWPRGAQGAYVCFLSNPQNLDISELISRPSESPFAMALQAAPMLLVMPNQTASIYTRRSVALMLHKHSYSM